MGPKYVGAHMPAKGGVHNALITGNEIGCTAVQVFTSSPQMWKSKPVTDEMAAAFQKAQADTGIEKVVSHDSYLVNLCAPDPEMRIKSINGLKEELDRCWKYGIPFAVSHIGAHMGQGEDEGLKIAAESLHQVLEETEQTTVLAETTAGQGSSLDYQFEQIARLIELMKGHPRLCVCLDTCHVFAAGYDISTREGYEETFKKFEDLIGFDKLKAVHCNDSKKAMGSRVDRHDHIGKGLIGETPFRLLMNDPRFQDIPILLETPEAETTHKDNLQTLLSYRSQ